jgi:hypothetical protein
MLRLYNEFQVKPVSVGVFSSARVLGQFSSVQFQISSRQEIAKGRSWWKKAATVNCKVYK